MDSRSLVKLATLKREKSLKVCVRGIDKHRTPQESTTVSTKTRARSRSVEVTSVSRDGALITCLIPSESHIF
ncbi:hypothetical protein QE152_g34981 [Popillia japonica]|uniref:Uncharacterized protein n=1 Tax=Popillia japonica TaxID=7064 RepID=A0AAW1IS05_POPJA